MKFYVMGGMWWSFMLWVVCGEVYCNGWYVVRVLYDGWYVVRVLCDVWYVVKFYVMGVLW